MSGTTPTPPAPQGVGIARAQSVNTGMATQNILSPANPLVQNDLTPTPVTFRFLWGLFQAIATLNQRLNNAGIP